MEWTVPRAGFPPESSLLHAELAPERNLPRVDLIGLIATGHDIQSGVQKRKIENLPKTFSSQPTFNEILRVRAEFGNPNNCLQ